MFTNPFTAKLNDDLTPATQEITMNDPIDPAILAPIPTYNPDTQTVIEITELESLKTSLASYRSAIDTFNARINRVQGGFRNFLRSLWENSDLDKDAVNEVFEEYGLPTAEKEFDFTATVTIQVTNIRGKGKDADEAWGNVDEDAIREAFDNGNYDTWSIDKPYHSDDSDEVNEDEAEPDFHEASIYNLA